MRLRLLTLVRPPRPGGRARGPRAAAPVEMRVRARTARIFRIDGAYLAAIPFSAMNARIDASMAAKGQPLGEPGSIFCLRAGLILTVRFCLRRRLEIFASAVLIGITLLDPHISYFRPAH